MDEYKIEKHLAEASNRLKNANWGRQEEQFFGLMLPIQTQEMLDRQFDNFAENLGLIRRGDDPYGIGRDPNYPNCGMKMYQLAGLRIIFGRVASAYGDIWPGRLTVAHQAIRTINEVLKGHENHIVFTSYGTDSKYMLCQTQLDYDRINKKIKASSNVFGIMNLTRIVRILEEDGDISPCSGAVIIVRPDFDEVQYNQGTRSFPLTEEGRAMTRDWIKTGRCQTCQIERSGENRQNTNPKEEE